MRATGSSTSRAITLARIARLPGDARAVAESARAATLHFAATHALSLTFVPTWLRGLESRVPTTPIELMSDVLQRCEDSMLEQRVDFLLCHAHPQVPGRLDRRFPSATIGHDALLPVAAPGPNDRRGSRATHRLETGVSKDVPILAFSAESGLGRIVSALRGRGASRRPAARPSSPRIWRRCCAAWRSTDAASRGCRAA